MLVVSSSGARSAREARYVVGATRSTRTFEGGFDACTYGRHDGLDGLVDV